METTSILYSLMEALGLNIEHDTAYITDLVMHINSIFSDLLQLGVGPEEGFTITGPSETWDSFINNQNKLNNVKTYIFLRLKKIFDPPTYSFVLEAINSQIKELEWRMEISGENNATGSQSINI